MHTNFADWYRIAVIDCKDIDLHARWTGVEAFAKEAKLDDILDSARLFYGLSTKDTGFIARIQAAFKSTDSKFFVLDNTAELRVLAGSVLADCFQYSDGWGDLAALCLTCGSFQELRPAPVGDIVRLAREHLSTRSASLRARTAHDLAIPDFAAVLQTMRQAFQSNGTPSTLAEPVANAFLALSAAIANVTKWAADQAYERSVRREESDVLWWLFSGQSRECGVPLAQLKPPAACLVAAKDLADLTATIPGPFAARAFLDKAVREGKVDPSARVALVDAVSACPADWRKSIAASTDTDRVEDLCPVNIAIRKAAEADGKKSWQSVFQTVTGLKPSAKLTPVDLAEQAYQEWLLIRAVTLLGK